MEDNIRPLLYYYYPSDCLISIVSTSLSVYNNEFKFVLLTVIDNILTLTKYMAFMKGSGHIIIEQEITSNCSQCGVLMCNICASVVSKNYNDKVMCLQCYYGHFNNSLDEKELIS